MPILKLVSSAGAALATAFAVVVCGCEVKKPPAAVPVATIDYTQKLPEGKLALERIAPSAYPDFSRSLATVNLKDLRKSAENSVAWFSRAGSAKKYPYLDIDHHRAAASAKALIELIDSGAFALPADQFNKLIADRFDVYQSIGAPTPEGGGYSHKVLFTGYFTPTYEASRTQGGPYQWPIYQRPADLIADTAADTAGRKSATGEVVPYFTRQQIESGALAGNELVWLTNRWNAYVVTIQGSARLKMPDGKIMEVGYAGSNGYAYGSPGQKMIADGLIAEKDISFETMRRYFLAHPETMDTYLWKNPRTVFFREVHGGPFGALNVPVTRLASIATDKEVYPPGMPAFLKVPIPAMENGLPRSTSPAGEFAEFSGFIFDQDRGGAIRSAGRCDIYMGIGQQAEETAGHQLNPGELYYLAVK